MNRILETIKTEFIEVYNCIQEGISNEIIQDSYEYFYPDMINFLRTKDKQWLLLYFNLIKGYIDNNMTKEQMLCEMIKHKGVNFLIIYYITNKLYEPVLQENTENNENNENNNNENNENNDDEINDVNIEQIVNNFTWRNNQLVAIKNTIDQNFASGIHNQIMGAGKTFIILKTIEEHFKKNPDNKGIYIITCSRQEILKQLFFDNEGNVKPESVIFFKDNNIIDLDKYYIINRVHKKSKKIPISARRPTLLIINTDFLKTIYKNDCINFNKINFIILDECHSVSAPKFYKILKKIKYVNKKHVIGFSATPLRENAEDNLVDIFNVDNDTNTKKLNIISNYDIINAIKDDIILPPIYILCEVNKSLNNRISKSNKIIMKNVLNKILKESPYKKVIGWCRTIKDMQEYYSYIKKEMPSLTVYCTSCNDKKLKELGYNVNYDEFLTKTNNCILLCVNRCREGSDIQNVDTAIYLDSVKKRSFLVSLQTAGRVLRKDKENKKTCGNIIDTFVNHNGIQIEVLTAHKIVNYYKKIFSLSDEIKNLKEKELYDEMIKITDKIKFYEDENCIKLEIDDNKNHDIKFKFELKTVNYNFDLFINQVKNIIVNKTTSEHDLKFNKIIDIIKKTNKLNINTLDFAEAYKQIPNKEELGLPSDLIYIYEEFPEKMNKNWYEILDLDTSIWYKTIGECRAAIKNIYKQRVTTNVYKKLLVKDNKLPLNPDELFRFKHFTSIENEFNIKKNLCE